MTVRRLPQVGLFSVVAKSEECATYATTRLCQFFTTEKTHYTA
jgi:hypothetical protein